MDRFADERDALNNKVKELIKSLREMKSTKDELSNKAADLKAMKGYCLYATSCQLAGGTLRTHISHTS